MKIILLNPFLGHVIRRRHTTLVVLRERGQEIELLFTSLKAMAVLAQHISEAVSEALRGGEGAEWTNPSITVRRRIQDEASDLLYDAGLLERPGFMRRPVIERISRQQDRSRAQEEAKPAAAEDPRGSR